MYEDEHGAWWDSYAEYVALEMCGLCGCGDSEIKDDLIRVLVERPLPRDQRTRVGDTKYEELILHVLDNAGLLEHGGNINGSWLNEKGKTVVAQLQ